MYTSLCRRQTDRLGGGRRQRLELELPPLWRRSARFFPAYSLFVNGNHPPPAPPPCHSRCAPCPVRVKHMRRPLPALAREAPGSDGAAHSATCGGGGDDGQQAWRGPRSRRSRIADRGWERPRDGCVLEGGPAG
eukprot:scaffold21331_cov117-Isochrysis_galbana.AAC.15